MYNEMAQQQRQPAPEETLGNLLLALNRQTTVQCNSPRPIQRILLFGREVHRIEQPVRCVHVAYGAAYISHNGRDFVLSQGESITLDKTNDFALVSTVRREPLIVELYA